MDLLNQTQTPTMSSKEIAKLTGKRHNHVLRDIRTTLTNVGLMKPCMDVVESSGLNKGKVREYMLPKRECDLVISGYSDKYRLIIIDRWIELEATVAYKIPQTYGEALRLASEQQYEIEKLKLDNAIKTPKANFVDALSAMNKPYDIGSFAKLLSNSSGVIIGRNELFEYLRCKKYLITGGRNNNTPYQKYINNGYFNSILAPVSDRQGSTTIISIKGQEALWSPIVKHFRFLKQVPTPLEELVEPWLVDMYYKRIINK